MNLKITLLALVSAFSSPVFAQEPAIPASTLETVLNHWRSLGRDTHFQKWQYDQWAFAAISCVHAAGAPMPKDLKSFRPSGAGTNRLADNVPTMCAALTQGPLASCTGATSRQPPFEYPHSNLRPNYVFLSAAGVPDRTEVVISLDCQLVKNEGSTRQFYVGPATVVWSQVPHLQELNTATGPRMVKIGNLTFKGEFPGHHAVMVVAR